VRDLTVPGGTPEPGGRLGHRAPLVEALDQDLTVSLDSRPQRFGDRPGLDGPVGLVRAGRRLGIMSVTTSPTRTDRRRQASIARLRAVVNSHDRTRTRSGSSASG
jgi:hypothetical protein